MPIRIVNGIEGTVESDFRFTYEESQVSMVAPSQLRWFGVKWLAIEGRHLGSPEAAPEITVGGMPCLQMEYYSDTVVRCLAPPGKGRAEVQVVAANITSLPSANSSVMYMPPQITHVHPHQVPAYGGGWVSVRGTNMFAHDCGKYTKMCNALKTRVIIDGMVCNRTIRENVDSVPSLLCRTSAHPAGKVSLSVRANGENSNSFPISFRAPQVLSVTPPGGGFNKETLITLLGRFLGDVTMNTTTTVTVGGKECVGVQRLSSEIIKCTAPRGTEHRAPVQVAVDGFTSNGKAVFTRTDRNQTISFIYRAPEVQLIDPATGPAFGYASVTITGKFFGDRPPRSDNQPLVLIDNRPCHSTKWISPTQLKCITPPMAPNTDVKNRDFVRVPVSVAVVVDGMHSSPLPVAELAYIYQRPRVFAVEPAQGPSYGGNAIRVLGKQLGNGAKEVISEVLVGGDACMEVKRVDDYELTCTVPPGRPGKQSVQVLVNGVVAIPKMIENATSAALGTNTSNATVPASITYKFLPMEVYDIEPKEIPSYGGSEVHVRGQYLGNSADLNPVVFIGGHACRKTTWISSTYLVCTSAPAASGFRTVTVKIGETSSKTVGAPKIKVQDPTVAQISPSRGGQSGETRVIITGKYFGHDTGPTSTSVVAMIGGMPCLSTTRVSNDTLVCLTPPGYHRSEGRVSVEVHGHMGGTTNSTPAVTFNYIPIKVFSADVLSGPAEGGYTISVRGEAFGPRSSAFIGPRKCLETTIREAGVSLDCTVPPGIGRDHAIEVRVRNISSLVEGDEIRFSYDPPVVTGVSPAEGPKGGSGRVNVTGSGFGSPSFGHIPIVKFGNTVATGVELVSDSGLSCIVPPGVGRLPISVEIAEQISPTTSVEYTYTPAKILNVYPTTGPVRGGWLLTIEGKGFGLYGEAASKARAASAGALAAANRAEAVIMAAEDSHENATKSNTTGVEDAEASMEIKNAIKLAQSAAEARQAEDAAVAAADAAARDAENREVVRESEIDAQSRDAEAAADKQILQEQKEYKQDAVAAEMASMKQGEDAAAATRAVVAAEESVLAAQEAEALSVVADAKAEARKNGTTTDAPMNASQITNQDFDVEVSTALADREVQTGSLLEINHRHLRAHRMQRALRHRRMWEHNPYRSFLHKRMRFAAEDQSNASRVDNNSTVAAHHNITFATGVWIGDVPCDIVTWVSDTRVECVVPAGVGAAKHVRVVTPGDGGLEATGDVEVSYERCDVTEVVPNRGSPLGGANLTIRGIDFGLAMPDELHVFIDGRACESTVWISNAEVRCIGSPQGAGGNVNVSVSVEGQLGFGRPLFSFDAPEVTAVTPDVGGRQGGDELIITGSNFGSRFSANLSIDVVIGSQPCAEVNHINNSVLICTTAPGAGVDLPVSVIVQGQQASVANAFSYGKPNITSVVPLTVPGDGGAEITLHGINFGEPGSSINVVVGGKPCLNVSVVNDATVVCSAPAGKGDQIPIFVESDGQRSNIFTRFEYDGPMLSSSSPKSADEFPVMLSVTGLNLGAEDEKIEVLVGSYPCAVTARNSSSSLTCKLDAGYGKNVPLRVRAAGRAHFSLPRAGVDFSFGSVPKVDGISPAFGSAEGGYIAVLSGSFGSVPPFTVDVTIGESKCAPAVWVSSSQIDCEVPAGRGGNKAVRVSINGAESVTDDSIMFNYDPPQVASVSPLEGPSSGGTSLTIFGKFDMTQTYSVAVGTSKCAVGNVSNTTIECITSGGVGRGRAIIIADSDGSENRDFTFDYNGPYIRSVSPRVVSPTVDGQRLTIAGDNFGPPGPAGTAATHIVVALGGNRFCADVKWVNSSSISCLPAEGDGHDVPIVVVVAGQASPAAMFSYSTPKIDIIEPTSADVGTDVTIVIVGKYFSGEHGGEPKSFSASVGKQACRNLEWVSAHEIKCTITVRPGGGKRVAVNIAGQTSLPNHMFSATPPSVTSVVPDTCEREGGCALTIQGSNFAEGVPTEVTIGDFQCADVKVVSNASITCTAPAGSAGQRNVTVSSDGAVSIPVPLFSYPPATVSSVRPSHGPAIGGTIIQIIGVGFGSTLPAPKTLTAFVGGRQCQKTIWVSDTKITCMVPAADSAATEKRCISVQVQTGAGAGTMSEPNSKWRYDSPGDVAESSVENVTPANIDSVLNGQQPVMLKVCEPSCPTCQQLKQTYEEVARMLECKHVHVATLRGDLHPALAQRYGVEDYPRVLWFPEGRTTPTAEYVGTFAADKMIGWSAHQMGIPNTFWSPSEEGGELFGNSTGVARMLPSAVAGAGARHCPAHVTALS